MKIFKILFALMLISAISFSCKSEKKDAAEAAEDAVEAIEEAGDKAGDAIEEGAAAVSDAVSEGAEAVREGAEAIQEGAEEVAEGVEAAAKGVEEMVVTEGVMTEDLADTPVIYPGCTGNTAEELRACSKSKFYTYLKEEFNKDLGREIGLDPGDHKITTVLHVDEQGNVSVVKVTSSNYRLEGEMKRLIKGLPQMTPATKGGQPIPVTFTQPFDFKME